MRKMAAETHKLRISNSLPFMAHNCPRGPGCGRRGSHCRRGDGVCALGGSFKTNSGHTEWVDGRVHQTGVTTTFTPNTKVLCRQGGITYDIDWTNQREGRSSTVPTYAAVTSRSYHPTGVNVVLMDGSVQFVANEIHLSIWRALSTRAGNEPVQP